MNQYVKLAKKAVETLVINDEAISPPPNLPPEMLKNKAGVFVTLIKNQELRGCIGTYEPTKPNIAEEIINNAIAAATTDFRFPQITKEELKDLSYTVYILERPVQVKSLDELDPKKYGVLIKSSTGKSGLLLPDLDGIDTVEKQLSAVCYKCGIDLKEEKVVLCRFGVKKYE
jgi:AmmeMemoRadiSam system protein A